MVGFTRVDPKLFYVIILKNSEDDNKILKVIDITAKLLSVRGFEIKTIDMKGDNFFSKVFSTTLLCDWVSYYLALNEGVDPAPVSIVDEFKKELKK